MKRRAWGVDLVMTTRLGRGFGVDDVTSGWAILGSA
jgi:hypothetical protein